VLVVARRVVRVGAFRRALVIGSLLTAGAQVLLALSHTVPMYVTWFTAISLFQAAMLPASNTLIAANVPRARRGTAFGLAGSAQALAFMVGPMSAAGFAAISLNFGFLVLGVMFLGLAVLLQVAMREPKLE
jgi:MFS family permease